MTRRYPPLLLWVDLETTGTSDVAHELLEVAAVLTTHDLIELDRTWHVVYHDEHGRSSVLGDLADNDVVRKMHVDNGLLNDVLFPRTVHREGLSVDPPSVIDQVIVNMLGRHGKEHDFLLAGSGTSHFDRRWIERHLPNTSCWLQYPNFDIGVLRRIATMATLRNREDDGSGDWFVSDGGVVQLTNNTANKDHRALGDVLLHIAEARRWMVMLRMLDDLFDRGAVYLHCNDEIRMHGEGWSEARLSGLTWA